MADDAFSRLLQGQDLGKGAKLNPPQEPGESLPAPQVPAEDLFSRAADELPAVVIAAMKAEGVPRVVAMGHGWAVVYLVGPPAEITKKILELK